MTAELERIHHSKTIKFVETPNDDGSFYVSWSLCTQTTWRAVLKAIKSMIPQGGRTYQPDKKLWLIASSHRETWEEIKRAFSDDENSEVRDELEERVSDEALAQALRFDISRLPNYMKERAIFAIRAVVGMLDVPVEYSIARDEFGAWDSEEKVWKYTDGRYSWTSPSDYDKKRRERAYDTIARSIEAVPTLLAMMEWEDQASWRFRFRSFMLAKYEHVCYVCDRHPENLNHLHMHRVIPGKDGGQYIEDNVVILCVNCHRSYEGCSWDEIHQAHRGSQS